MAKKHLFWAATLLLILLTLSGCAVYGGYAFFDPPPVYGHFGYYHSYSDGNYDHHGKGDRWDRGNHYGHR